MNHCIAVIFLRNRVLLINREKTFFKIKLSTLFSNLIDG